MKVVLCPLAVLLALGFMISKAGAQFSFVSCVSDDLPGFIVNDLMVTYDGSTPTR